MYLNTQINPPPWQRKPDKPGKINLLYKNNLKNQQTGAILNEIR